MERRRTQPVLKSAVACEVLSMSKTVAVDSVARNQLQTIIAELTEGIIVVESDGRISWANDAALAMHELTSVAELGGTIHGFYQRFALSYRNHHVLQESEYPGHRTVGGEAVRDIVVNVARRGEEASWTHKIRSLILKAEGDSPSFCAIILDDATEGANAEKRFEKTFNANPAPAIICRLDDLRYIKVNQGFLEMTGHHREGLIGHSVYEIDVLENADRKDLAVKRLHAHEPIPQMEARLNLPTGGSKAVVVAGQPIEIGGQACILFTFIDLEHRKKAEVALAQSEERFFKAFQLAPVPMLVSSLEGFRILNANDAFVAEFGHGRTNAVGRTKAELSLWTDEASQKQVEKSIRETGRVQTLPLYLGRSDGRTIQCLLSAETVSILGQDCVLTVLQNVDEKRRGESDVIAAVEAVLQDSSWLGKRIVEKMKIRSDDQDGPDIKLVEKLSTRQRDVLVLIAQGLVDFDIAAKLGISRNTVKNHIRSIYDTIGVRRRSEVIVWARKRGFE